SGELRRREAADELPATALDGPGHVPRVGLEIGELGGVQRVADAQCEHDVLLFLGVGHARRVTSTRNASIQPEASGLAANAGAIYPGVMGDTDMLSNVAALLAERARTRGARRPSHPAGADVGPRAHREGARLLRGSDGGDGEQPSLAAARRPFAGDGKAGSRALLPVALGRSR